MNQMQNAAQSCSQTTLTIRPTNGRLEAFAGRTAGALTVATAGAVGFFGVSTPFNEANPVVDTSRDTTTAAMEMRRTWMRQMGYGEDEIAEFCDETRYPADLREETRNVEALARLFAATHNRIPNEG